MREKEKESRVTVVLKTEQRERWELPSTEMGKPLQRARMGEDTGVVQ